MGFPRTFPRQRLFLFDVDGTLLKAGGAGRDAFIRAWGDIFDLPQPFDGVSFAGRTDAWILRTGVEKALGRVATVEEERAFMSRYLDVLPGEVEKSQGYQVLPGVHRLLSALTNRGDCVLGLCTGNVERGARSKLERGDLNRYFSFGGFSSDSTDRTQLTAKAIEIGLRKTGKDTPVVVIGDSILDAKAARENNVNALLVATGWTCKQELMATNPWKLLDGFDDFDRSIAALLDIGDSIRTSVRDAEESADIVRAGGVIVYPTSTLYGIGGDASNPAVGDRIRRIKRGFFQENLSTPPRENPFILLTADIESAFALVHKVPVNARILAERFWPGPLTLVLDGVPKSPTTAPDGTVAVRVDPHPLTRKVARLAGCPLISTSANFSSAPPPATHLDVDPELAAVVDRFVIDEGPLAGLPSTIVRCVDDRVDVLREGAISNQQLALAIGEKP